MELHSRSSNQPSPNSYIHTCPGSTSIFPYTTMSTGCLSSTSPSYVGFWHIGEGRMNTDAHNDLFRDIRNGIVVDQFRQVSTRGLLAEREDADVKVKYVSTVPLREDTAMIVSSDPR